MLEVLVVLYYQEIQYQCALMLTGFLCFVLNSQRISALSFSFLQYFIIYLFILGCARSSLLQKGFL